MKNINLSADDLILREELIIVILKFSGSLISSFLAQHFEQTCQMLC